MAGPVGRPTDEGTTDYLPAGEQPHWPRARAKGPADSVPDFLAGSTAMNGKFDTTLFLSGREVDVTVAYDYTPAVRGRWYLRNGDPGYPDEPAEVCLLSAFDATGADWLSDLLADDEAMGRVIEEAHEDAEASRAEELLDALADVPDYED